MKLENQTLPLACLFSVSDADGDSIIQYQLWDSTPDPASGGASPVMCRKRWER